MRKEDRIDPPVRKRSIFKPRNRKPNFLVSTLVCSVRLFALLALIVCVAAGGTVLGIVKAYTETAPELDLAVIDEQAETSFFYDADGNMVTDYKGSEDRVMVSIDEIPKNLQHAFVAVEDARFYTHNGIDAKRIVGAFVSNLMSSSVQGGSTITQQLIKNSVLSDEQSYKRKIQEAYLAMQLEKIYTKDEILESYLNTIYLGESYYGVKTAAAGYFGKDLNELSLRECAMLAGLARSPYYYNPRRNYYTRETPEVIDTRADYALRQMYENQFITYDEYQTALDHNTARILEEAPNSASTMYEYPYYVEYAVQDVINTLLELNSLENTTANRALMENRLRTGGYHVYMCLDTEIQKIVEETLKNWDNYPLMRDPSDSMYRQRNTDGTYTELIQPQAAAVVLDYRTGELKAVVGGRTAPTARKTLNRATDMTMPVGSAIKPIAVYAPAIELGCSPATIAYNMPVPIHGYTNGDGKEYYPSNYGGSSFTGPTTLRQSLKKSYNISAAQTLMNYVGVENSVEFLHRMGVNDANINATPFGLALGSSGLTPVQMTVAFGTLGNGGIYQEPISFSRIEDSDGNVIVDRRTTQKKSIVFKESTAWLTIDMMKEAVASGTGTAAKIKGQTVAGKTGTNSDYRGVTFTGLTGWYSGSVWIGHDNYKALSSKATGGNYAAPLWQAIMERIHTAKALDDKDIIQKSAEELGLVRVTTCGVSGMLATNACASDVKGHNIVTDYWAPESVPAEYCNMHQQLSLCADTGLLATEFCPSVVSQSAVIIPIGHPLYDYIDQYSGVMQEYLGEFAALKLTEDDAYNEQLIAACTCTAHSAVWRQEQELYQSSDVVGEARALLEQAYSMLTTYGSSISQSDYVSVSYCIRQLEQAIDSYSGIEQAMSDLRYSLQLFGAQDTGAQG